MKRFALCLLIAAVLAPLAEARPRRVARQKTVQKKVCKVVNGIRICR